MGLDSDYGKNPPNSSGKPWNSPRQVSDHLQSCIFALKPQPAWLSGQALVIKRRVTRRFAGRGWVRGGKFKDDDFPWNAFD